MMPYKEDIFAEVEAVLAQADTDQIEQLLSDIANGAFPGTALTRAGSNDSQVNVTDLRNSAAVIEKTACAMAKATRNMGGKAHEQSDEWRAAARDGKARTAS